MGKQMESLIVASKVREYIKSKGCMTSSEAYDALNAEVARVLDAAVKRAKDNKRSTVKPQDL